MKKYLILLIFLLLGSIGFGQSFDDLIKRAEQGDAEAQFILGVKYDFGEGILTDKQQAKNWIKKAYENGYEKAKEFWDKNELWKY